MGTLARAPEVLQIRTSTLNDNWHHSQFLQGELREGFSKGFIMSIAQTPDGYLRLGTEFGLLRFDGVI